MSFQLVQPTLPLSCCHMKTSQAYAQELSLSSPMRKTSMFHQVRNHHSPCSPIAHFSMQSRLNAAPRTPCSHYWHGAHQALDRVNKLEKIVECQSRFISRLVRVVRHIAPERLFRPSSTAREPYEPDLGEFSLDSELGSEGDDPIDEEESSSHCHT
ncbi:unnamed protein product [Microthlaspi erraticum]|uniref:Uncharacterized protein n=1 Tax=Microthlaspi erraticum TaxID=1685480 RepID=A0A6D2IST5_9BRAS|nr:unnamed protein product [Microthlaspi erraticum]